MPKSRVATAVAAALALACPAKAAEGVTMDGVARSASLMRQIAATCADADRDLAVRGEKAFVQIGEKAFGKAAFDRALAAEQERRAQEVRTTGSDRWCADQRERFSNLPGEKIFGR